MLPFTHAAAGCCRFDIVLLLLDQHEPTWDKIVSDHVLTTHQQVSQECLQPCMCVFGAVLAAQRSAQLDEAHAIVLVPPPMSAH